jgi:predicted Abi (CAAX) family protease
MLDPNAKLPDGRTNLRQTLDYIEHILAGTLEQCHPQFIDAEALRKRESAYARYRSAPWNRAESYPVLTPADEFRPVADWTGRLILPQRDARFGGAWLELRTTPKEYAQLTGQTVQLQWNESLQTVRDMLRAVRRDVSFSAEAYYTSTYGGFVHPVRLNRWRLVDPLESLAGAHPVDDVFVKLAGPVVVESAGDQPILRIAHEPVQIAGCFFALVRFLEAQGGDAYLTDRGVVRIPPAIDRAVPEFGEDEWYVYGLPDAQGTFVVLAMAPSEMLRADIDGIVWRPGDRALVLQIAGGTFGHFAYGLADVVDDEARPRFEKTYYHLFANNTEGLISGAADWSRAMGDRQYGWAGERSVLEVIIKDESLERADDRIALQLGAMAARYRIGDGTGGSYTGIAHNSTQDSNRALAAALPKLRKKLQPFAARSWSKNDFSLGSTFEDAPWRTVAAAIARWRSLLPRLARDAVVDAFSREGAEVTSTRFDSASFRLGLPERREQYRLD